MVFSAFVKIVANVLEQELSDCTFTDDSILRTCFCCDTIQKVDCWFSFRKLLAAYMEVVGFRLGESPQKMEGFESLIFQEP